MCGKKKPHYFQEKEKKREPVEVNSALLEQSMMVSWAKE